jgi:acetyltransferase-like isoleucine patch superfamily enzyme
MAQGAVLHDTARVLNMNGRREAVRVGGFTHVRGELFTFAHGGEILIGGYCYIGEGTRIWSARSIRIGERVLIAHNVTIMDSLTHPIAAATRHEHFRQIVTTGHPRHMDLGERPVDIGDDVWIGCMSVILRGVTLGKGAIVGAGSVVTEAVPPWTIVGGNPARVIREIIAEER